MTQPSPNANTDDNYTPEHILYAHNKLVEAVARGELNPDEAQAISQLVEARRSAAAHYSVRAEIQILAERLERNVGCCEG